MVGIVIALSYLLYKYISINSLSVGVFITASGFLLKWYIWTSVLMIPFIGLMVVLILGFEKILLIMKDRETALSQSFHREPDYAHVQKVEKLILMIKRFNAKFLSRQMVLHILGNRILFIIGAWLINYALTQFNHDLFKLVVGISAGLVYILIALTRGPKIKMENTRP